MQYLNRTYLSKVLLLCDCVNVNIHKPLAIQPNGVFSFYHLSGLPQGIGFKNDKP